MGQGAWSKVHGARCMEQGAWGKVHGARCMEQAERLIPRADGLGATEARPLLQVEHLVAIDSPFRLHAVQHAMVVAVCIVQCIVQCIVLCIVHCTV